MPEQHTRISLADRASLDEQINHHAASARIAEAERDRLRAEKAELLAALDLAADTFNVIQGAKTLCPDLAGAAEHNARAAIAKAHLATDPHAPHAEDGWGPEVDVILEAKAKGETPKEKPYDFAEALDATYAIKQKGE